MRKICFLSLFMIVLASFGAHAVTHYRDSIVRYQARYKSDLSDIIKGDTANIRFYPPNRGYCVKAKVIMLKNQPVFDLSTSSGKTKQAQTVAKLTFRLKGKTFMLYAYQLIKLREKPETKDELFVPFTDNTNGITTYGGGRYVDLDLNSIHNNTIIIDFNKAYNPYCAFTTGYNCPIPPKENYLNTKIAAGETYLKDKFEH